MNPNAANATNVTALQPTRQDSQSIRRYLAPWQIERLNEAVPQDVIKSRQVGGGSSANYVQKEYLTNELHNIFGTENVTRETLEMSKVGEHHVTMPGGHDRPDVPGFASTWACKNRTTIRIPLDDGSERVFVREGFGTCTFTQKFTDRTSPSEIAETAIKGAETDAFKRAVSSLGRRFGLDIEAQEPPPTVLTSSQERLKNRNGATQASTAQGNHQGSQRRTENRDSGGATDHGPSNSRQTTRTQGNTAAVVAQRQPDTQQAGFGSDPWDNDKGVSKSPDYGSYQKEDWINAFRALTAIREDDQAAVSNGVSKLETMLPAIEKKAQEELDTWFAVAVARLTAKVSNVTISDGDRKSLYDRLNKTTVRRADGNQG